MRYESDEKAARDAIYIISPGASNPSGVLRSLADMASLVIHQGKGTDAIKSYPPFVLAYTQLVQLVEGRIVDGPDFNGALKWCEEKSKEATS